ncbi:hypothetical protein P7C73_g2820, partial [Tremellales sp. Uapishka_1]
MPRSHTAAERRADRVFLRPPGDMHSTAKRYSQHHDGDSLGDSLDGEHGRCQERADPADRYMRMISLSLFLINLLPLPHTDGSHLVSALLSFSTTPATIHTRPLNAVLNTSVGMVQQHRSREYDTDSEDEMEFMEEGGNAGRRGIGGRESAWKRRLRRALEIGLLAVVGGWWMGWGMLALLRSS